MRLLDDEADRWSRQSQDRLLGLDEGGWLVVAGDIRQKRLGRAEGKIAGPDASILRADGVDFRLGLTRPRLSAVAKARSLLRSAKRLPRFYLKPVYVVHSSEGRVAHEGGCVGETLGIDRTHDARISRLDHVETIILFHSHYYF